MPTSQHSFSGYNKQQNLLLMMQQIDRSKMYRPSKITKPIANIREHKQRNVYARKGMQQKQLFRSKRSSKKMLKVLCGIAFFAFWAQVYKHLFQKSSDEENKSVIVPNNRVVDPQSQTHNEAITDSTMTNNNAIVQSAPFDEFKCSFRKYKPHRYYPVDDISEKFLSDAEYIRGELPYLINPRIGTEGDSDSESKQSDAPKKICTDTSDWEHVEDGFRPFTDGQNPSFISLSHDFFKVGKQNWNDPSVDQTAITLNQIYGPERMDKLYLGLLLFGDSQCRWNMSDEELKQNRFSPLQKAPEKRSMVMILDENLNPIGRAVLRLERDAPWGKKKKFGVQQKADGTGYETSIVELDDARLFFHDGRLHVLYRNGPAFGYDKQLQNVVHLNKVGGNEFEAVIKASESFSVCCGRNIAFISEIPGIDLNTSTNNELFALTWIDPVTTEIVKDANPTSAERKLMENFNTQRRRLGKQEKSSIHGTNGYLVPMPSSSELLGVAHFHRPENRDQSDYARHGHHYTHAFFTLEQKMDGNDKKFALKRISNEFVFMAPSSNNDKTGDVIQFASGIDIVGSDESGKLMISYGINDCEAAIVFVDMEKVHEILLPVESGEEVVNLMKKLS